MKFGKGIKEVKKFMDEQKDLEDKQLKQMAMLHDVCLGILGFAVGLNLWQLTESGLSWFSITAKVVAIIFLVSVGVLNHFSYRRYLRSCLNLARLDGKGEGMADFMGDLDNILNKKISLNRSKAREFMDRKSNIKDNNVIEFKGKEHSSVE